MKRLITLILQFVFFVCFMHYPCLAQNELWGMTEYGGDCNKGAIFKTDCNGNNQQLVYSFGDNSMKRAEYTHLCEASNGKLYGMTSEGGSFDKGVIFEYDPATSISTHKYSFDGSINGGNPYGSLLLASNGKLYGMTVNGGINDCGVLFEFDPATSTYTKMLNFDFYISGSDPYGSLMQASNDKLYGLTSGGGPHGLGVLFEYNITTTTITAKYYFDYAEGTHPYGSLLQAANGKLYGMTKSGGDYDMGTIFEYDPVTSLYTKKKDFTGITGNCIGSTPYGSLIQASNGKLYGMTTYGGIIDNGVIFEYNPATSAYTKKFDFVGTDGGYPYGSLMQASNGKLYGMTHDAGTYGYGVLFEYNLITSTFIKKVDFIASTSGDGGYPWGSLMQASNGKLYGMTSGGGTGSEGVLFEYIPGSSTDSTKINFDDIITGIRPCGSLMQANNGKLYGMTKRGGYGNYGVIFEYNPATSVYTKIFEFVCAMTGAPDGSFPNGSLIQANNGKLYGMTTYGGNNEAGTIFYYDLTSSTFTKAYNFAGSNGIPFGDLVSASNGNLYGMTSALLFEYVPDVFSLPNGILFNGTNGGNAYGSLMQATNGKLYGMTSEGGNSDNGVLFEFNPANFSYVVKHLFNGTSDGRGPMGSLTEGSNGKLYGMCLGGNLGQGVIFEYDPVTTGYSIKHDFAGGNGGSTPKGSLVKSSNGKLYGMTSEGGANNLGIVFEYDPATSTFTKKLDFNATNGGSPLYSNLINVVCNPPQITAGINDVTVCAGRNTSFTSSASGIDLNYQWQVNSGSGFSDIANSTIYSNATENILRITGALAGMNNYQYRCVVSSNCSSVTKLSDTAILYVNPIDVSISISGITLNADTSADSWQWVDCNNGYLPINGQINQSFTPTTSDNYAVIITQNGCTDTSACQNILGIEHNNYMPGVNISPNPATNSLTIDGLTVIAKAEIYDISGKLLLTKQLNTNQIDISSLAKGFYFIKLTTEKGRVVRKFVKE